MNKEKNEEFEAVFGLCENVSLLNLKKKSRNFIKLSFKNAIEKYLVIITSII